MKTTKKTKSIKPTARAKAKKDAAARQVCALLAQAGEPAVDHEHAEIAAALNKAREIVAEHGLNTDSFDWPDPPVGYDWDRDGRVVKVAAAQADVPAEEAEEARPDSVRPASEPKRARKRRQKTDQPTRTRANSKQATLIEMLKRPDGATARELMEASGWQAHTLRGFISGALKKKLGLNVQSRRDDGSKLTHYWID